MPKVFLTTLAIVLIGFAPRVEAEVIVADTVRYELLNSSDIIEPGNHLTWDLSLDRNDHLEVAVQLNAENTSGMGAFVCPREEYIKFIQGGTPRYCNGVQSGEYQLNFAYQAPYSGSYILFIDNSHSVYSSKQTITKATITQKTPEEFRSVMTSSLGEIMTAMHESYIFDDFNIFIAPCGQENAFSHGDTGDITICTELFFKLSQSDHPGAILGVFFHEIGHTLLNLWDLPGWRNEQMVDEFSTIVLLAAGEREALEQTIKFFSGHDPIAQAVIAQTQNTPHPLSVQRMRNIGEIIDYPDDYMRRWARLFYQHAKTETLRSELKSTDKYSYPQIAREMLAHRGALEPN